MSASKNTVANNPFELKGSLFTLTVLHLNNADIAQIDGHLGAKVSQAPGFFQNVPVVIDLENLSDQSSVDFSALYSTLRKHGLVPVAVRNGSDALHKAALGAGLPGLSAVRSANPAAGSELQKNTGAASLDTPAVARNEVVTDTPAAKKIVVPGRIHTQPVRSGQQIYAQGGDLIVLGAVSAGAEVLADGSVHIYGPLRGRALAGVQGDNKARIFCQNFEAQLVSVAGQYRLIEQIDETLTGQFIQIYLQQDRLIIEPLTR